MTADPTTLKRVLRRYPKGEVFHDASIDISAIPLADLLAALGVREGGGLVKPRELDEAAVGNLGQLMRLEFDRSAFDFFVHAYSRDPQGLPSEDGPAGVPPEPGNVWTSIRPQNGEETYVQVPEEG